MRVHVLGNWCGLALVCLCACDAGEIVVFQGAGTSGGVSGVSGVSGVGGTGAVSAAPEAGAGASPTAGSNASGSAGLVDAGAGQAGALPNPTDRPCRSTRDCDSAWLCEKLSCFDEQGTCAPRPASNDPSSLHVCGCDNVTYWNDTLRRKYGISAILAEGECQIGARACKFNSDCRPGATCSHLLPPLTSCSPPSLGTCWVTPTDCPTTGERAQWLPCPPPDGTSAGPPPSCRSTCQAVQSGFPHVPVGPSLNCP